MNVPVARRDFSNARTAVRKSSASKGLEGRRGTDVGINLIDGHFLTFLTASLLIKGTDVGINLIDGHGSI